MGSGWIREVFVKIQNKNWGGGQCGYERRSEVFVEIQNIKSGGGGSGCRVWGSGWM